MSEHGYTKGQQRKREIIESAAAEFGQSGYRASSLRDIAARVGISHAGLLHHFGTKETLLLAVLDHRDWLIDTSLHRQLGDSFDPFLHAPTLMRAALEERGLVELFAVLSAESTNPEHPAHHFFRGRYARVLEDFAARAAAAQAAGLLSASADPLRVGAQLAALMDGLQIQWLLQEDAVDPPAAVEAFLRGCGVNPQVFDTP